MTKDSIFGVKKRRETSIFI